MLPKGDITVLLFQKLFKTQIVSIYNEKIEKIITFQRLNPQNV